MTVIKAFQAVSKGRIKVAFVVRDDASDKPGGDVDLTRKYASLIAENRIVSASIVAYNQLDVSEFDVITLFAIDQPFHNYLTALECNRRRVPYVIYTLHHKTACVERFLRYGTYGAQRIVAQVAGFSPYAYETIMGAARPLAAGRWINLARYRTMRYAAKYVLKNASRVVIASKHEGRYIARDFGITGLDFEVIPHSLSHSLRRRVDSRDSQRFVLCAGRIEPRKNQLAIARLAIGRESLHFLFIGKKNLRHPEYIRAFDETVSAAGNTEWRENIPLEDLQTLIESAAIYVNLSWFEVFSLVDLMALAAGRACLLSTCSYLYDHVEASGGIAGIEFVAPENAARAGGILDKMQSTPLAASRVDLDCVLPDAEVRLKWVQLFEKVVRDKSN